MVRARFSNNTGNNWCSASRGDDVFAKNTRLWSRHDKTVAGVIEEKYNLEGLKLQEESTLT